MSEKLRAIARFSDNGATYADDGRYRLWLEIFLHDGEIGRTASALMMNPSTARTEGGMLKTDNTIAKLVKYARRESCDRLIVVNVCAVRLTDSRQLHLQRDPVGNPLNDVCIREALALSCVRFVGWGKLHKSLNARACAVRRLLREIGAPVHALAINADGSPGHPLYLPDAASLVEFRP